MNTSYSKYNLTSNSNKFNRETRFLSAFEMPLCMLYRCARWWWSMVACCVRRACVGVGAGAGVGVGWASQYQRA